MKNIKLDITKAACFLEAGAVKAFEPKVKAAQEALENGTCPGNDFLGWLHLPTEITPAFLDEIEATAKVLRENCEAVVVAGIGGSYLGARAVIEALSNSFGWLIQDQKNPTILFAGNNIGEDYLFELTEYLKDKKFAINVISKSGTTTETAIGFRLLRGLLESKLGKEEAAKAIYATTDKEKGALLTLSKQNGYERFVLPGDVGGRYSVFTAVGLLPMAVAGIDIAAFMAGAKQAKDDFDNDKLNECYRYAIARHALYKAGKPVEMFVSYEPRFVQLGEWWKQLFGESEGKEKTGILPDSATFSTDLHSLGQYIQDGTPILFETVLDIAKPEVDVAIPHDDDNLDGLNYLDGKTLDYVNKKAEEGTIAAHAEEGKVPNLRLTLDEMSPKGLGYLMYFYMRACAMSAYLNKINPFNQPGVEIYKKNMFHLLGKPGY